MSENTAAHIRVLNDAFRKSIVTSTPLGKVYMTSGVAAHGEPFGRKALEAIANFEAFNEDIDPYGEGDMVRVVVDGITVWGKIDYFATDDPDLSSDDPADEAKTRRVLTILLPSEW